MKSLKNVLLAALGVSIFAMILMVLANFTQWFALRDYPPTVTENMIDYGELIGVTLFSLLASFFMIVTMIVTAVLFLVWIFQLHRRARSLHTKSDIYHPGWGTAFYLIPFVNLIMPFIAMWKLDRAQAKELSARRLHTWVFSWWGCILVSFFASMSIILSTDLTMPLMTVGEMRSDMMHNVIISITLAVAGAVLLPLVHRTTDRLFIIEQSENLSRKDEPVM